MALFQGMKKPLTSRGFYWVSLGLIAKMAYL